MRHRHNSERHGNKLRPLKICLKDKNVKCEFLNNRQEITNNNDLYKTFHERIYVNSDNSFLAQKEELRLRQKLKMMKNDNPSAALFSRTGVLHHDGRIVDRIGVKNQLF